MKLKIFYSWQSTTNQKYNRYFILDCIKKSVKKLKNKPELKGVELIVQEGVTGESGSVQVASRIADKRIPNCDIFIADLSVINHINKPRKIIRKLIRDKFKPIQSNNVIYEYGIAYEAIGEETIIGVLNNTYGSPKENPDNIPFDLRHLRFPIEYNYSDKNNDKKKAQKVLISEITNAIKESAIIALKNQKDKYRPLINWKEWESKMFTSQKFYLNDKIAEVTKQIKEGIKNPNESIRLIGLSGLGKTRLLFETFRIDESAEESITLNSRVLYLNYSDYSSTLDYQQLFIKLKNENEDRVVILDNCPQSLHRKLLHFIKNNSNIISLITIDSNPEEIEQDKINDVNYIVIKKEDLSSVVNDILEEEFPGEKNENKRVIKDFSQGIPLMAVLIIDSIKNGEQYIGRLDDKELLNKLLGKKGKESKTRTILKSCSLFNYFGNEDKLKSQLEFIATNKNITSLSGDDQVKINDFYEVCNHFLKREIFEKKGRLIGMRPFPLAMYLTQEWLEPISSDRLVNLIKDISNLNEPDRSNLSDAISERMKYLGFNDKAKTIVKNIVGLSGPFDNAEVLNTELGSRLFRSFVEVNPVSVSKNLVRAFSSMTKEELINIKVGRRNLVWVIEKLCFDKRTFNEAIKIMYAFAIAENETWSNNATGQFLHLFKVILAGTEASLDERWEIIKWGLKHKDEDYCDLAIKAMKSALTYGHFSRMIGSEKQGSKVLNDYKPTREEVTRYWTNILQELVDIIKSKNKYSEIANITVAESIRSICNAGLSNIIIPIVEEIAIQKKYDWDEGLKGLKQAIKYDKSVFSKKELEHVESLIKKLTKDDFKTKYTNFTSFFHLDNEGSYSTDKEKEALIKLADEFIKEEIDWESNFEILYLTQQNYSYFFGKRIFELIHEKKELVSKFIHLSLQVLNSTDKENRHVAILGGFIADADKTFKNDFYNSLSKNENLNYLLFYFISIDNEGKEYYQLLYDLVDEGKCELKNFKYFNYSNSLANCDSHELRKFSKKLFLYGSEGYELVFDLFFNLSYNNDKLTKSLLPIFKICILKLGFNRNTDHQLDSYKWTKIISTILESEREIDFAKYINKSIIKSITWDNTYSHKKEVQEVYEALIKYHFNSIWPDLSKALLSKDDEYVKFYSLKHILGSHIGGIGRSIGVLFDGNIETIFEWCEKEKPLAPMRLAELIPVYGGNNNQYSEWHPIAKRLVNEFGDIKDVLHHLSINMGSYSWTGSIVPLLEAKKKLFKTIENHEKLEVSTWAKNYLSAVDEKIRLEKNKDEEMYL